MPRWDVLVAGGGVMGMAIALELALAGQRVVILEQGSTLGRQASWAAAGMLAPQAEALPPGPLADLCHRSLAMYPDWVAKVESFSDQTAGLWLCGILQPLLSSPRDLGTAKSEYLDRAALSALQPDLAPAVQQAAWFPQEGQVDNRLLAQALQQALKEIGVARLTNTTISHWDTAADAVTALQTSAGPLVADHYVLAMGAWSGDQAGLPPLPIRPVKGQMLAVRDRDQRVQRVLFGEKVYLVPRQDGRLLVGATVEEVGFAAHNTVGGVQSLLLAATTLMPAIATMPLEELWWGYRPGTPDEAPLLGPGPYRNLTLATGHYRNGILLAPITARFVADWLLTGEADPLLSAFDWQRPSLQTPARR